MQDIVLDGDLTPSQRSEFAVYSSYLRNKLYPVLLHLLWDDKSNYGTVTHQWYSSMITFPWSMFYLEKRRKHAQSFLKAFGKNENTLIKDGLQVILISSFPLKYIFLDFECPFSETWRQ